MRSGLRVTRVGPKCNEKSPYKRDIQKKDIQKEGEEGHAKPEAVIGVMWPQAKERQELPEAGRGKGGFYPRAFREHALANISISDLRPS